MKTEEQALLYTTITTVYSGVHVYMLNEFMIMQYMIKQSATLKGNVYLCTFTYLGETIMCSSGII